MYINRKRKQIIRQNPIYDNDYIVLEQLTKDYRLKDELKSAPKGYVLSQAFAYFANEKVINPNEWEQTQPNNNFKQLFDYEF